MLNISEDVLAVLIDNNLDYKDVVKKLALYRPEVLLKLLHMDDLVYQIQEAIMQTEYGSPIVTAIKEYRRLTGTSLKDAKVAVEHLRDNGQLNIPSSQEWDKIKKRKAQTEQDVDNGWPDEVDPEDTA